MISPSITRCPEFRGPIWYSDTHMVKVDLTLSSITPTPFSDYLNTRRPKPRNHQGSICPHAFSIQAAWAVNYGGAGRRRGVDCLKTRMTACTCTYLRYVRWMITCEKWRGLTGRPQKDDQWYKVRLLQPMSSTGAVPTCRGTRQYHLLTWWTLPPIETIESIV